MSFGGSEDNLIENATFAAYFPIPLLAPVMKIVRFIFAFILGCKTA